MKKLEKWINLAPALIASLIDIAITIIHQPKAYWQGNLEKANEGNPIGAFFMSNHIGGLFLISAIWLILIVILGYYLPKKVSKYFLLFTLMAHTYGASTWINPRYGFWLTMALILFNTSTYLLAEDYVNKLKSFYNPKSNK